MNNNGLIEIRDRMKALCVSAKGLDSYYNRLKRRLTEHPDAVTLTQAYENMPVQINLHDPSLPVIAKQNE